MKPGKEIKAGKMSKVMMSIISTQFNTTFHHMT